MLSLSFLFKLVKGSLDLRRSSTTDDVNNLALVVKDESRDSGDLELGSDLRNGLDVELEELDVGVLSVKLLDQRRDHLARTTPGSEEVNKDLAGGGRFSELVSGSDAVDHSECI